MLTCPKCGEAFLSKKFYNDHTQKHLQTHIDTWSRPGDQNDRNRNERMSDIPDGLNRELFKTFEKYRIDSNNAILCLWKDGQLNVAMRSIARQHELIDRVKEWIAS